MSPEWEFDIVSVHPHLRGIEGEKHKVCVHFSGSNIPPKKRSIFRSCGTIMVLVECLPQNPHKQQSWGSSWDVPFMSKVKGLQCFPEVWIYLFSKGIFYRLGNPRLKMLCLQLSRALSKASWAALSQRNVAVTAALQWRIHF